MKINDLVYAPCDFDILEFKVTGIREYEDQQQYELTAVHNVGAQGRVKVLVADAGGRLRYVDCLDPEDDTNERGLEGFIDCEYFSNRTQASLKFYEAQELLSWTSLQNLKRQYDQQAASHARLCKVVAEAKEQLRAAAAES